MPTYTSECQKCGEVHTYVARIANRNTDTPVCCGKQTIKVIDAPRGFVENIDWDCPVTGTRIKSLRQRTEHMKRNNLIEAEPL